MEMKTLIDAVSQEFRGVCAFASPPAGMLFADIAPPPGWRTDAGVWVLVGDAWVDTPDHRGEVWHNPATGDLLTISAVGEPPAGYVLGPLPKAEPSIESLREVARGQIDAAASKARARYLSAGVGQDLTYQVKYREALEYLRALDAATPPGSAAAWPYVAAEALATGLSEQAAATRIAQTGAYWEAVIGPQIEAARIAEKDALEALDAAESIAAHVQSVIAALGEV